MRRLFIRMSNNLGVGMG